MHSFDKPSIFFTLLYSSPYRQSLLSIPLSTFKPKKSTVSAWIPRFSLFHKTIGTHVPGSEVGEERKVVGAATNARIHDQ